MKKNKGITLIALVITIIVLLILAGVTIATLTGDNGLLSKAQYAKEKSSDAEIEEQIKIAYQEYQIAKFSDSNLELENSIKTSLEKVFDDTINVEKQGKSIKIAFTNANKSYKYYSNGTVKELMNSTATYWWYEEGTLYLRSTYKEGYVKNKNDLNFSPSDVIKIKIEEPVAPTSCNSWFVGYNNLIYIENIKYFHTENLISMYRMFSGCVLNNIDFTTFDTSMVNSMAGTFEGTRCDRLDLSNFDTYCVNSMGNMFRNSNIKELVLGKNFIISEDSGNMFTNISSNIKIKTTRDIAGKIKQIRTDFTDANFEIID